MAGFLETLRSGDWLTFPRMRLWVLAVLAASAGGIVYLVATSDGLIDYQGRPLGTDFSNVYAAGTHVLDGNPAAPFDPRLQHAREQAIFGEKTPFYGWHYPPFFLAVAAALALLPYQLALIVWQGVTLALYLLAIRAIARFIPPPQGKGGERSEPAGVDGKGTPPDHRFAAATLPASRGRLWLLLALAFPAVFVNLGHGHNGFLTAALIGFALVQLDRRPTLAASVQGAVTRGVAAALIWCWRSSAPFALKAAALCLAAILATPYSLDYDLMVLAPAIAFLAVDGLARGFGSWQKTALAFLWIVPLIARGFAQITLIPLAVIAMLLLR